IDYVIKKDGSYIEIKENNFKEKFGEILKDCEKVIQKLNNNSYKYDELEKAVKDYYNCNEPEIPEEKYDSKLLGSWDADLSDKTTKDNFGKASIRFENGTISYSIFDEKSFQSFSYSYKIRGDSIISFDPTTKTENITKYRFDGNDKLILEI